MRKEITNSKETSQPFVCSDELIEQGVDSFRPILEKAGVFGPKSINKYKIYCRKGGLKINAGNCLIRTIMVEDISGASNVFPIKPGARINLETITRFVDRVNRAGVKTAAKASRAGVKTAAKASRAGVKTAAKASRAGAKLSKH